MKILMLTWEYPPRIVGGIARVVHDLSKRLIKDGHDVTVVTYRDGDTPYFEDDKGVKVYRVDNYNIRPNNFIDWIMQLNFNMVAKASEIIAKEGNFDVIHAHDWLVANAAKTLKHSYDIPLVSTIHATEAGRNSGIHDETQRYINDTEWLLTYESTEVIVNSNFMKGDIQRVFGLPFEKINVIPNLRIAELLFEESSPLASGNDYYFIGGGFILNFSSFRTYPVNAVTKLKKSMTPADENSSSRYHVEIKLDKSLAGVSRDILSFSYCSERDQAYSAISDNYYSLTGSYPDLWEKYNK